MVEGSENYDSDSWGVELIDEILGKFTKNHSGDHGKHLLIGSKRPKIAKEVSKNMVTKKIVRRVRDDRYTSNTPSMDTWCRERQIKGYGPKIKNSQSTDFIEKKINVEIKVEDSLESSEIISVQTSKTDMMPSTDSMENSKRLVEKSTGSSSDTLENCSEIENMNDKVDLNVKN